MYIWLQLEVASSLMGQAVQSMHLQYIVSQCVAARVARIC